MTFADKEPDAQPDERFSVPITTDDYGAILLRFENCARGTLHVSQVTAGRKPTVSSSPWSIDFLFMEQRIPQRTVAWVPGSRERIADS